MPEFTLPPLPYDYAALSRIYRDIWWQFHLGTVDEMDVLKDKAVGALAHVHNVEAFLWPRPGEAESGGRRCVHQRELNPAAGVPQAVAQVDGGGTGLRSHSCGQ